VYAQPAVDVGATNTNPILDTNGEFATTGQEHGIGPGNKYFFLTGTFGGTADRSVTVPRGKALFFPVINSRSTTRRPAHQRQGAGVEGDCEGEHRCDNCAATFDAPVTIFRSTSPTLDHTLPPENSIYDYFGLVGPGSRAGSAVADGYRAYLPPPAPGTHVLKFQSANSRASRSTSRTMTIVGPGPATWPVRRAADLETVPVSSVWRAGVAAGAGMPTLGRHHRWRDEIEGPTVTGAAQGTTHATTLPRAYYLSPATFESEVERALPPVDVRRPRVQVGPGDFVVDEFAGEEYRRARRAEGPRLLQRLPAPRLRREQPQARPVHLPVPPLELRA
jgi:hypothetical protein